MSAHATHTTTTPASSDAATSPPTRDAPDAADGRDTQRTSRERAHEPTLRAKLVALIALALMGGVLLGIVETMTGHHAWPMVLGMVGVALAVAAAAEAWVVRPMDELLRQAERVASAHGDADTPRRLRRLPLHRGDEVGQLARCMHQLGTAALHGQREARTLRREMHSQIDHCTRRATRQLYDLAHRDALTGLGNRRCLDQHLDRIVIDAAAQGQDLVCVALDVDNFKPVNDLLGHARGDDALRCLGELLEACIRPGDLAVRLGGDEFVLLMPGAPLDAVAARVHQLRSLFRQRIAAMLDGQSWADLSIGVATMRRDGCHDGQTLLDVADAHLYKAKRAGKGRTHGLGHACDGPDEAPHPAPASTR